MELADGCWTMEAGGETVDSCEQLEDMPGLDEVLTDPQPIEDLLAAVQDAMTDYENPGFIVKQHDGQWFVSPLATLTEQLFAVVRALDRAEIEELRELATGAVDAIDEEAAGDVEDVPVASVPADSVPADPTEGCYAEFDATSAAACFQDLLDAGAIDELSFPLFLQYPECGLADVSWSGEYYSLPDAEFIALVEETAPCFRALVDSGELDEYELPLEMSRPDCLEGRNWYAVVDDEAYFDTLDECATG